jgi:hypothetical protein
MEWRWCWSLSAVRSVVRHVWPRRASSSHHQQSANQQLALFPTIESQIVPGGEIDEPRNRGR